MPPVWMLPLTRHICTSECQYASISDSRQGNLTWTLQSTQRGPHSTQCRKLLCISTGSPEQPAKGHKPVKPKAMLTSGILRK